MRALDRIREVSILKALSRIRFIRFGVVGFSGTLINIAVLYLNQAILLRHIHPPEKRLHISLAIAIFIATFNNYLWNRYWTWGDRQRGQKRGFFVQMAQYYLSCTAAIFLQYLLTTLLAEAIHYLIANMISIALAAVFVYVINDIWTFSMGKGRGSQPPDFYGPPRWKNGESPDTRHCHPHPERGRKPASSL